MKPEHQANILAKQAAYQDAARKLDAAEREKASPEEIAKLRKLCNELEAAYERAIDEATGDT